MKQRTIIGRASKQQAIGKPNESSSEKLFFKWPYLRFYSKNVSTDYIEQKLDKNLLYMQARKTRLPVGSVTHRTF